YSYIEGYTAELQITLFDSQDKKFKLLNFTERSKEGSDDGYICSVIQRAMKASIDRNMIEFKSSFVGSNDSWKIWTRFTLDEAFVKILSNLLIGPKIRVQYGLSSKKAPYETEIAVEGTSKFQEFDTEKVETFRRSDFTQALGIDEITYSIVAETEGLRCALQNLFIKKTMTDCSILTSNKTEIKCHGCVLATNSDVFLAMLTNGLQESQTKRIEMTDLADEVVNTMLLYLYGWEINSLEMTEELAFDLLCTAHKYNITALERDILKVLLDKPDQNFELETVIALYFFAANIEQFSELCEKALNILQRNKTILATSSAYHDLLQTNPKEVAVLANFCNSNLFIGLNLKNIIFAL
ncbi:Speckle-type POZ protein, partial [Orchesella cincta]